MKSLLLTLSVLLACFLLIIIANDLSVIREAMTDSPSLLETVVEKVAPATSTTATITKTTETVENGEKLFDF